MITFNFKNTPARHTLKSAIIRKHLLLGVIHKELKDKKANWDKYSWKGTASE